MAQNVIAWGDNSQGQCDVPAEATNVIAVAGGSYHSLALRADGTVVGWGSTNTVPAGLNAVTSIAAGLWHSLALRADGTVVAWGNNDYGQATVPATATNVVAIAAGYYHNLALRADGSVVAWGRNWNGECNIPSFFTNVVALSAGYSYGSFLRKDGSVWSVPPSSISFYSVADIVGVSILGAQTLALTASGGVVARGWRIPPVPTFATNVVALAGGTNYALALRGDGTVVAWGSSTVTNLPATTTNVIAIAAGIYHGLAVRGDEMAPRIPGPPAYRDWASAGNSLPIATRAVGAQPLHYQWLADGVAVTPTDTPFPVIPAPLGSGSIACQVVVSNAFGSVTSAVANVAVTSVHVWGDNHNRQCLIPPTVSNPVAIAAGEGHCLALSAAGSVLAWGKDQDSQANVPVSATSGVVALAAGASHSLALRNDGTIVAWGRNWDGQTTVPPEAANAIAVSAGWAHSLALRSDGTVIAWGNNDYGQTNIALLPTDLIAVSSGYFHNLALRSDGTVVTWGWSVPTPAAASNVVAIAAGWEHCLALRADGTLVAWGDNSYGQSTVPVTATNVVAIAAGYYHNLALRTDGSVVAWGRGACGVTNIPQTLSNAVAIAAGGDYSLAMVGQGPPTFTRQPVAIASAVGGQAILSADVTGAFPMSFQWFHDGVAMTGATNRYLLISNTQTANSGTYSLLATNSSGQATSQAVSLSVRSGPSIVVGNTRQLVAPGQNFCLAPQVLGAAPLNLRWQFNGINLSDGGRISGSSSGVLCVASAEYADSGNYCLVAVNAYGAITSLVASVTITPVLAWGDDSSGQLDVPASATNVLAIAGGAAHSLALRADGLVVPWGDNTYNQNLIPPSATNVIAIAEGGAHSVALRADGNVVCWGDNSIGQTNVSPLATNVVAIAAGSFHTLALRADGTVVAWGSNTNGQTTVPSSAVNVIAIAAGDVDSFALRSDGTVVCWRLGPAVRVGNVVAIAAGDHHILALQGSGVLTGWGADNYGQASVPSDVSNIMAVAASGDHSLALGARGTVAAWGADDAGQSTVTALPANVLAVAAGGEHSLALVAEPALRAAPSISQQPLSGTVLAGGNPCLYVRALGAPSLSYQWYFNGAPISGATHPWLGLNYVQTSQAGPYQVVVTNGFGSVTSLVATLSVQVNPGAPTIVGQPAGQSVPIGTNAFFSVSVNGFFPLYYQWQKDGVSLSNNGHFTGVDTAILSIYGAQPSDAGSYRVVVTNAFGTAASLPATLSVFSPVAPSIVAQPPAALTLPAGTNADLTVVVSATAPLAYQWRFNQTNLAGASDTSLVLTNLQSQNSGDYDVVVTNLYGAVTSIVSRLTVIPSPPWITWPAQPFAQVLSIGQSTTLIVAARGTEPLTCQWRHNGINLTGATNFTLQLNNVNGSDSGMYEALVSNAAGSASAKLTVSVVTVVVWGKPDSPALHIPGSATNVVALATGMSFNSAPCLALRADGTLVAWGYETGPTNATIGFPAVDTATNMVAIAVGGTEATNTYCLAVSAAGSVAAWGTNPAAQPPAGLTDAVAVAAGGYHALALRENGAVVAWGDNTFGQATVPLDATNVLAVAAGTFHSLALRADGNVVAWGDGRGEQTQVPEAATNIAAIAAGASNNLALRADGGVLCWSAEVTGCTNLPPTVTNLTAVAAGDQFDLALRTDGSLVAWGPDPYVPFVPASVTNVHLVAIAAGTSHVLALASDDSTPIPPVIGRKLSNRTAIAGQTLMLCAGAVGSQPLYFQWYFNGTPLPGQTNQWLAESCVQPDQAGCYQVVMTNAFGCVTSTPATITLSIPAPVLAGPEIGSSGLTMSFYGFRGISYAVEFSDELDNPSWLELDSRAGKGSLETLTTARPTNTSRFYRLRIK